MSVVPVFKQPATFTPRQLVREAQVLCRIGSSVNAADFLGSDSAGVERDESLARYINLSLEEFYGDFPHLSVVTAGFTTTALDPFCDLPTGLHQNDIQGIFWNDSGSARENHKVQAISQMDIANLPPRLMSGQVRAEWPNYYAVVFDHTSGEWKLKFIPTPSQAKGFTVVYRTQPMKYEHYDVQPQEDAVVGVTIEAGVVTDVTITSGGTGYRDDDPPVLTIEPETADPAEFDITVTNGVITAIDIINGGSDQNLSTQTVTLTGGRPDVIPVPDSDMEPLIFLLAERIQQRNTGTKSPTPETLRAQYESFKKQRAYIQPTDDELRNGAFSPLGVPPNPGWEDKSRFEALPNILSGDTFQ